MSRQSAKRWVFTINNPQEEDKFWETFKEYEYICVQEEKGHEEETTHYQGCIIFKKKMSLSALKKINPRAHWEIMRGTPEQAADYCKKDDTYTGGLRFEDGELPKRPEPPKAPERLAMAIEELDAMKEGYKRPREVSSLSLLQPCFTSAMREIYRDILGPYRPNLKIVTLIGPPGTGKSFAIQKHFPDHGRCIAGNNGVWFQNGDAPVMLFEEFCGQIRLQQMLQFLDPYPLALEVKGGMIPAQYTLVIITSNTPPCGWYLTKQDDQNTPFQKRNDALLALYDRIGYHYGSFSPVRDCGTYLEAPLSTDIDSMRDFFDSKLGDIKHLLEEDDTHLTPLTRTEADLHEHTLD